MHVQPAAQHMAGKGGCGPPRGWDSPLAFWLGLASWLAFGRSRPTLNSSNQADEPACADGAHGRSPRPSPSSLGYSPRPSTGRSSRAARRGLPFGSPGRTLSRAWGI